MCEITKLDIIEINNIANKIVGYDKYFKASYTEKPPDSTSELLKNIEIIVKIFNKSWDKIDELWYKTNYIKVTSLTTSEFLTLSNKSYILDKIILKLFFYINININIDIAKSILKIFNENNYTYSIETNDLIDDFFVQHFINIDVLKNTSELLCKNDCGYIKIGTCISDHIFKNMVNNECTSAKIEELKTILTNLNILNYKSDICIIAEFLCQHMKLNKNIPLYKIEYNFISKLHNHIYYDLNLLDTVEFKDTLKDLLVKYKLI